MARTLALLTISAALLAGCGSDGGDKSSPSKVDPSQAFATAASKTSAAKTFKIASTTQAAIQGQSFSVVVDGGTDVPAKKSEATLDFSSLANIPGASTVLAAIGGAAGLKGELVSDLSGGDKIYLKLPALNTGFGLLGAGSLPPYGSLDLDQIGTLAGFNIKGLLSASQSSGESTALLSLVDGKPTVVGNDTVRGTPTTHYRATIDFTKTPTGASADAAQAIAQVAKLAQQAGAATKVPVDVWIDKDGFLRRESFAQTITGGTKETTTVELYDFDKPVTVTVPPASQTWDILATLEKVRPGTLAAIEKAAGGVAGGTTTP